MTHDPAFQEWIDKAKDISMTDAVALIGWQPKKGQRGYDIAGPCPMCRGDDRFAVNTRKNAFVCHMCGGKGRGGLSLVMFANGLSTGTGFMQACEIINGCPPPKRRAMSDAERAEIDARIKARREAAAARDAAAAADVAKYSREELERARHYWSLARPIRPGGPVARYLAGRGLPIPETSSLREIDRWKFYGEDEQGRPVVLHEGPAMFGRIRNQAGEMIGLHITYIDPKRPGKKLEIPGPDGKPRKAKKFRASHKGGFIPLVWQQAPERLYAGEGIETVLSVLAYMRSIKDEKLENAAFFCGASRDNLGGTAAQNSRVWHPNLFPDKNGHLRRKQVPGPVPDFESACMPVPPCVREIIWLGDNDGSDVFTTAMVLERAMARNAREGREQRIVWSNPGSDFNDMWVRWLPIARARREAAREKEVV